MRVIKPVNNSVIANFYMDRFEKRMATRNHKSLTSLSIVVLYVLVITKNSVCLFFDLDYDTRLMLYDISYLMGGIPQYNQIMMTLPFIFGLIVSHTIHFSTKPGISDFVLLLKLVRGQGRALRLFLDRDNAIILDKLTLFAHYIYRILNVAYASICKYHDLLNVPNIFFISIIEFILV